MIGFARIREDFPSEECLSKACAHSGALRCVATSRKWWEKSSYAPGESVSFRRFFFVVFLKGKKFVDSVWPLDKIPYTGEFYHRLKIA